MIERSTLCSLDDCRIEFDFSSIERWKQYLINQCNTNDKILESTLCNVNRLNRIGTLLSVFMSNLWLKC